MSGPTTGDGSSSQALHALADIAHTFQSADEFTRRIGDGLDTLRQRIVTCDRCAVLESASSGTAHLIVSPDASLDEQRRLHGKLTNLFRLMIEDEEPSNGTVDLRDPHAARSHLALPLSGVDRTLGVLFIERDSDEPFGEESLRLLSLVAGLLAGYLVGLRAQRLDEVINGVLGQELRSPLSSIVNAAYLLRSAVEANERQRQVADRLWRSTKRAEQLIDNVLDFARGEAGIQLSLAHTSLEQIGHNVVRDVQLGSLDNHVIVFSAQGSSDGTWDPRRLTQAVQYLLENALQHGQPGEVRVAVDGEGGPVRLAVTNRGCIREALMPRLFQPFRRGESLSAGMGLGLYIVRQICRAHGGRVLIACDRERDETTATIELPRVLPRR